MSHRRAISHLRRVDPRLSTIIDTVGSCTFAPAEHLAHFTAISRSIVFQQLSGKAAATIYNRFADLFPDATPTAPHLASLTDDQLRAVGLSRQKTAYLRDLAASVISGRVPIDSLDQLPDEEVIAALVSVKGIGRWTAQMFLMFRLGRPDVLPDLDLGIQKGIQRAYRMRKLPTPKRVTQIGAKWAPYRTVASWYLWRSLDSTAESRQGK
jgi:3-methyladenine DNA glycosylase/8-oxoguanine DNA glycosylase